MKRSQKRLLGVMALLVGLLLISAILYMAGMGHLEGKPRGFWQSLEWAGETLSTTGYGADANWHHPVMVVFVVLVQFVGVFFVFLVFPIYMIPYLEERFQTRLPDSCPGVKDHVLIFRHGPAVATLIEELEAAECKTVVIEEEEAVARRLHERGYKIVLGNLDEGTLSRVGLKHARALIVNSTDHRNAAVIITARQQGFTGDILALVEDPLHRQPIILAGATAAYTPRHILGAALAAKASRRVNPSVSGIQHLGDKLEVTEARISKSSVLRGKTLAEADIGRRMGVTVIGQWVGGKLLAPPTPDMLIEAGGILIMVGGKEKIAHFTDVCTGTTQLRRDGPFIVAGFGEVGKKVVELLGDAGEQTRVISCETLEGVDVAGNVLDPRVLERAEVRNAQAVILALSEDATTLFATVILKDMVPDVPVIARVNRAENVERIYGAGAEFALSISQVSGQILARKLLGKQSVSVDPALKVVKVTCPQLAGQNPAGLRLRDTTGCSVVAVDRGDELIVEFGPAFAFQQDDNIYICGSEEATRVFSEVYPGE